MCAFGSWLFDEVACAVLDALCKSLFESSESEDGALRQSALEGRVCALRSLALSHGRNWKLEFLFCAMAAEIRLWFPILLLANVAAALWVFFGRRLAYNSVLSPIRKPAKGKKSKNSTDEVQSISIVWKNVSCTHTNGKRKTTILHRICGQASSGELTALMGPSGAGKSTLLDILSMRKNTGKVNGEILMNGIEREKSHIHLTCYVPQDDTFVPSLTCLETLQFYAGLLLSNTFGSDRCRRIQDVFEQLDLAEHQQTLVGGILPGGIRLKGLSGGQRRRLNIAIGIISSPSVIFLDEPTSGLDSFAAVNVIRFVKNLAQNRNHTIIATIHQPRLDIWRLFSRVVLLSKGILMYEGITADIHPWFSGSLGYSYEQGEDGTIPEWCLDLVSIDFAKPLESKETIRSEKDLLQASEAFLDAYDKSREEGLLEKKGQEETSSEYSISLETPDSTKRPLNASLRRNEDGSVTPYLRRFVTFWRHFLLLSWRSGAFITRNPASVGGRLFTIAWVAASVGVVFYNIPDTPQSIPTRFNVLFMSTLVLILFPYLSVSHASADKVYLLSDMSSRLYSPFVYYLSKTVVQIPFQLMNVFVFVLIVYGMTGLRSDSDALVKHLIILTLAFLIFSQILNFAAILAPSEDLTFIVGVCFVAFNLMFSDFFIRKDQMRFPWLGSLSTLSPMKYIFEALTEIEFRDRHYYTPCLRDFEEAYLTMSDERRSALPFPKEVISYVLRSMSDEQGNHQSVGQTVAILFTFLLVLHLCTFLILSFICRTPVKR